MSSQFSNDTSVGGRPILGGCLLFFVKQHIQTVIRWVNPLSGLTEMPREKYST